MSVPGSIRSSACLPPQGSGWPASPFRVPGPILFALALLGGCLTPTPRPLPRPAAESIQGDWEEREEGVWIHHGPGEGILLLPGPGELFLRVRLFPSQGCRGMGLLTEYRALDRTQGILLEDGLDPRLSYFRREGALLLEPPGAVASLPRESWNAGLLLELTTWPGVVQATLPEVGRSVVWHAQSWTGGRVALFARGSGLFRILAVQPPPGPAPVPTAHGLLARVGPYRDAEAHLGKHLAAGLGALEAPESSPAELLGAWLWTGRKDYRDRLRSWVAKTLREQPSGALLEGLLAGGHLLGPEGEDALEPTALGLVGSPGLSPDAAEVPLTTEALLEWIQAGRALGRAQGRLKGKSREVIFQAHRSALGRLVTALQPWEGTLREAGEWETEVLLAAAAWIWEARSIRSDAGRLLVSLGLFLEERRLAQGDGCLVLRDRAGEHRPDLTLAWALALARRGALAEDPACRAVAEVLALGASEGPAPFTVARDLAVELPHLAPPGTLSLAGTSGQVLSVLRLPGALHWTTQGPSTEVVLAQVPDLLLEVDGRTAPARGPLLRVVHREGTVRLVREATGL